MLMIMRKELATCNMLGLMLERLLLLVVWMKNTAGQQDVGVVERMWRGW